MRACFNWVTTSHCSRKWQGAKNKGSLRRAVKRLARCRGASCAWPRETLKRERRKEIGRLPACRQGDQYLYLDGTVVFGFLC
jgi:hypothetical protein